jgi:diaminopimelate decarboxylase
MADISLNDLLPVSACYTPEGSLTIARQELAKLAKQFGTPLYVYDGQTIRHQIASLQEAIGHFYQGSSEITYAAKAYFSLGFARRLADQGIGVDVVSLGELKIARQAGFSPLRVHLHGNNKSEDELVTALKWGVQAIVVDSLEELGFLSQLAEKLQLKGRVWLRITPGITVDTHHYTQTAHSASKFGLPVQDGQAAEAIRQLAHHPWLTMTGLHTHLGSQFFEAEPYREAVARLTELAENTGIIPQEFSPGGGWGVPYTQDGKSNDPQPWIETVAVAVEQKFNRRGWPLPRLVVEPGRWIVARAGLAIYTIGTSKTANDGTQFLAVDGGLADNVRPALYQAQYTALPLQKSEGKPVRKVTLVGKFCETGDILIPEVYLPPLQRGDLLAVPVAGAYQLSMSSNYNLAARPAVLWLEEGQVEVLQAREKAEESAWWTGK